MASSDSSGRETSSWNVMSSVTSQNTINPIRQTVENICATPNPDKNMIHLSLGDPCVFGNFPPPQEAMEAVEAAVRSGNFNGYAPSIGYKETRDVLAELVSTPEAPVTGDDICLACGCSDALNLSITLLANPGDNVLMPRPGFSIYKTFCGSLGAEARHYNCLPEKSWECDVEHMRSLIDERTRAIVLVNPSNPCGSNFTRQHLDDVISVAENFKVPIIADEIYADMVFSGQQFHSVASVAEGRVPVLQCGGMAKRFLVPGWRMGWVVVHDRKNLFGPDIRKGLFRLSQKILGPCTLVQRAAADIVSNTPQRFHDITMAKLEEAAMLVYRRLQQVEGLTPVKPSAAMYMMVGFDQSRFGDIKDDVHFTETLINEESVMCLPGKCFEYPNYFRLVLTVPIPLLVEACDRISQFCARHITT